MRVDIDNERKWQHRIISVKDSKAESVHDYLNVIIDALLACRFSEEQIQDALLNKCHECGLIEPNEEGML